MPRVITIAYQLTNLVVHMVTKLLLSSILCCLLPSNLQAIGRFEVSAAGVGIQ